MMISEVLRDDAPSPGSIRQNLDCLMRSTSYRANNADIRYISAAQHHKLVTRAQKIPTASGTGAKGA